MVVTLQPLYCGHTSVLLLLLLVLLPTPMSTDTATALHCTGVVVLLLLHCS